MLQFDFLTINGVNNSLCRRINKLSSCFN